MCIIVKSSLYFLYISNLGRLCKNINKVIIHYKEKKGN